jgi:hypothetical protein
MSAVSVAEDGGAECVCVGDTQKLLHLTILLQWLVM